MQMPLSNKYFKKLRQKFAKELALHQKYDSWDRVIDHCLAVAARVDALSRLLNIPPKLRTQIVSAALVHDFYKRKQIELITQNGLPGYSQSISQSSQHLLEAGFDSTIAQLASSSEISNHPLLTTYATLGEISLDQLAMLIVAYCDFVTTEADWAIPSTVKENDIDRRAVLLSRKKVYQILDSSAFTSMCRVGHLIEKKFASLLNIPYLNLPEVIDSYIKSELLDF
ncbi:hypothetical protein A2899_03575 [Candidatus Amesbacteria bacterium RIFCSPLOWO2_01_FULL_49_25]|nr:MAG: hypothetical protein A2899_03575 [Candidatus Amesbacteria bacterium RIFCSPLOWO2_01_FULL_49_25]